MSSERWIDVIAPARGRATPPYQSLMTAGSGFDDDYEPPRNARIKCTNVPEALKDDELQALVQLALDDGAGFPLPLHYPDARAYCIRRRLITRQDVEAEEAGA